MTRPSRPNLAGLFDGSTPPVASFLTAGPPALTASEPPPAIEAGPDRPRAAPAAPPATPREQRPESGVLRWFDPIAPVEQYFSWLQAVVDATRSCSVSWGESVRSMLWSSDTKR